MSTGGTRCSNNVQQFLPAQMISSYFSATLAWTSNSTACLTSALPHTWVIVMEHLIRDWNKALLCKIGALRSFSFEKLQYWRERASGMSSLAYFLARDTIDQFNTIIKPILFLSMFYFFNAPRSSFIDNYVVLVVLVYCVTGIGYTFAICFQPGSAQLWSALFPVVLTLVATQPSVPRIITNICYTKWALEAFVIVNAERYSGVWLITRCGSLSSSGYDIKHWGLCLAILFVYGFAFRCLAFFCLITVKTS